MVMNKMKRGRHGSFGELVGYKGIPLIILV